jgi:hypothetical protein
MVHSQFSDGLTRLDLSTGMPEDSACSARWEIRGRRTWQTTKLIIEVSKAGSAGSDKQ